MRVAVVYYSRKNEDSMKVLVRELAGGIEEQGHDVEIIDAFKEPEKKLTGYKYLAFGSEVDKIIGGKLPAGITKHLAQAGHLSGKRSFAFVKKTFISSGYALRRLMQILEKEGIFLKNSYVFNKPEEAAVLGKKLHIS